MNSPDSDLTKPQRFRKLREIHLGLTQTEFGQALARDGISVNQNYVSAIERGARNAGSDIQNRIEARYRVRRQWLDEGIGEVFSAKPDEALSETERKLRREVLGRQDHLAPRGVSGNVMWVSRRDQGRFLLDTGKQNDLPRFTIPLLAGEGFAFEVTDNSMLPTYVPGGYVLATRLEKIDYVQVGSVYVLQTPTQFRLLEFGGREGELFCFTKYYPVPQTDLRITAQEVTEIYLVEFKLMAS